MSRGSRTGGMPGSGAREGVAASACAERVSVGLEPQPHATAIVIAVRAIEYLERILEVIWILDNKGVIKIVSPQWGRLVACHALSCPQGAYPSSRICSSQIPTIECGHGNGRRNGPPHLAGSIVW